MICWTRKLLLGCVDPSIQSSSTIVVIDFEKCLLKWIDVKQTAFDKIKQ